MKYSLVIKMETKVIKTFLSIKIKQKCFWLAASQMTPYSSCDLMYMFLCSTLPH